MGNKRKISLETAHPRRYANTLNLNKMDWTLVDTPGEGIIEQGTNGKDTAYVKYDPTNRGFFELKSRDERRAMRKAGEPANEEYLKLQNEFIKKYKEAKKGNIGWNRLKDDVKDIINLFR